MTLLVTVLCSDGGVIGADKQATHGSLGMMTVGQPLTKISIVSPEVLFASSGHHGMSQQFEAFIVQMTAEQFFRKNNYSVGIRRVQDHFRPIVEGGFKTAAAAAQILGQAAQADCICSSILATPFKDGLKLVEVTPQVAVEYLTPELSFLSMGSGKATADPFLGFLKDIFWPNRLPSVREGALAAYWTIKHATDLRVSGVGMGIELFTIEKSGDSYTVRNLDETETAEHDDFISSCEDSLRSVATKMAAGPVTPAPTPPGPVPDP